MKGLLEFAKSSSTGLKQNLELENEKENLLMLRVSMGGGDRLLSGNTSALYCLSAFYPIKKEGRKK